MSDNNRYQLIYSKHSEKNLVYSTIQCKFLGVITGLTFDGSSGCVCVWGGVCVFVGGMCVCVSLQSSVTVVPLSWKLDLGEFVCVCVCDYTMIFAVGLIMKVKALKYKDSSPPKKILFVECCHH